MQVFLEYVGTMCTVLSYLWIVAHRMRDDVILFKKSSLLSTFTINKNIIVQIINERYVF